MRTQKDAPDKEEEESSQSDSKERKDATDSGQKVSKGRNRDFRKDVSGGSRKLKFVTVTFAALFLTVLTMFAYNLIIGHDRKNLVRTGMDMENLNEENLTPFFIPPSRTGTGEAARIDISVVWDGLAAVKYRKKEIRIRNKIYNELRLIAENIDDLKGGVPFMEEKIAFLLMDSLEVNNLSVKIREIKFL
jgi:hypothetical protein